MNMLLARRIRRRLADWAREILADSPETASQTGVQDDAAGGYYNDRLDDRSSVALEARRSAAVRRYAELRALDVSRRNDADRLTYNVLRDQFANAAGGAAFNYGDFGPMSGAHPKSLPSFRGDSQFGTWLRTLTNHKVAEFYRKRT